ncbi:hypothetical protein EKO23_23805 [Nocardioides guangzhouensis]|uniref:Uncharacterized protein n=1 Tax=Nocardioides guangzhouensis TaxID=2497878 RepID=A0A4Q4Z148_9ACTN|nr:hypothetical protein [Nocardioides guangzhouensis]RYP81283.1 hypothetical protein EKO23_23805 [Nocardioides guangzhouensis]
MMLYINAPHDPALHRLHLEDCSNIREADGWYVPCPTACKAHFDAWADPRLHDQKVGGPYTPLPNSILAWVSLLPGTTQLGTWTHNNECYDGTIVSLYANHTTFFEDDQAVPVWVVVVVGATEGAHYCALFDNEVDARAFYISEVNGQLELLADC